VRLASILVAAVAAALPGAAHACMDQSYETYVLSSKLPGNLPRGILSLKIWPTNIMTTGQVEIIDPVDGLRGIKTIRVDPGSWSSCSRWGDTDSPGYVTGVLERAANGEIIFKAIQVSITGYRKRRSGGDADQYIVKSAFETVPGPDNR
jgi:hypothetical protein